MVGFTKENVEKFVRNALGDEMAQSMMEELAKNNTMAGLMRTPLFAAIACQLHKDGKPLPKCATGMFEALISGILSRSAPGNRMFTDLGAVPFHQFDTLLEVGRFALLMLKEGKVIFTQDDVERMVL